MKLTKLQRNDIFQAIEATGLDPAECDLFYEDHPEVPPREVTVIRHSASGSAWYIYVYSSTQAKPYAVQWVVTDGSFTHWNSGAWAQVLEWVSSWADEVKGVAETPDLWAEVQRVPKVLAAAQSAGTGNTPFSPDEQAEITRRLSEVKQLVREKFELTEDQLAVIDQRLDDAEEAAKHTDRKTWLYTLYGAVMSTFMTDEIPPHVIQTIMTTVLSGIGHLFGIGGPLPVIGP